MPDKPCAETACGTGLLLLLLCSSMLAEALHSIADVLNQVCSGP